MVTRLQSGFCDTAPKGMLWWQGTVGFAAVGYAAFVITPAGYWFFSLVVWHKQMMVLCHHLQCGNSMPHISGALLGPGLEAVGTFQSDTSCCMLILACI
jgi:hypothetical protein